MSSLPEVYIIYDHYHSVKILHYRNSNVSGTLQIPESIGLFRRKCILVSSERSDAEKPHYVVPQVKASRIIWTCSPTEVCRPRLRARVATELHQDKWLWCGESPVWHLLIFTSTSLPANDSALLHDPVSRSHSEFRRDVCRGKHRELILIVFPELELIIGRVLLAALKVASAVSHQMKPLPSEVPSGESRPGRVGRILHSPPGACFLSPHHLQLQTSTRTRLLLRSSWRRMHCLCWSQAKHSHVICPKYPVSHT